MARAELRFVWRPQARRGARARRGANGDAAAACLQAHRRVWIRGNDAGAGGGRRHRHHRACAPRQPYPRRGARRYALHRSRRQLALVGYVPRRQRRHPSRPDRGDLQGPRGDQRRRHREIDLGRNQGSRVENRGCGRDGAQDRQPAVRAAQVVGRGRAQGRSLGPRDRPDHHHRGRRRVQGRQACQPERNGVRRRRGAGRDQCREDALGNDLRRRNGPITSAIRK